MERGESVIQRGCNEKVVIDTLDKVLKIKNEGVHFLGELQASNYRVCNADCFLISNLKDDMVSNLHSRERLIT